MINETIIIPQDNNIVGITYINLLNHIWENITTFWGIITLIFISFYQILISTIFNILRRLLVFILLLLPCPHRPHYHEIP